MATKSAASDQSSFRGNLDVTVGASRMVGFLDGSPGGTQPMSVPDIPAATALDAAQFDQLRQARQPPEIPILVARTCVTSAAAS